MDGARELDAQELRRTCSTEGWSFETTDDAPPFEGVLGQPRALAAVDFGVGVRGEGFNLYAAGPQGLGKHSLVGQILRERAALLPAPSDWCYVNNFSEVEKPRLIEVPAGRGHTLRRGMLEFVDSVASALAATFESDEYQTRRQLIDQEVGELQEEAVAELNEKAGKKDLALLRTPMGIAFAPMKDGEVLAPADLEELEEKEREHLGQQIESLQEELKALFRKLPRLQRERRKKLRELNRQVSLVTVRPLVEELEEAWRDLPQVMDFLEEVQRDVIENARSFISSTSQREQEQGEAAANGSLEPALTRRYGVNVLVDHSEDDAAPVVYEDNPTYTNLLGRVDYIPRMGALVTDFGLIRPGALHRANGGYLILDADRLLAQPFSWQALKRTLQSGLVRIESLGQAYGAVSTYSLEPEPMPLETKVVLLGDHRLYYLLSLHDPDFRELFKVNADFDDALGRDEENEDLYARLVARLVRESELRPFDRGAVAATVEQAARISSDGRRLSLSMGHLRDFMREASWKAGQAGRDQVTRADFEAAVDARAYRSDRLYERTLESIERGTILLDTEGSRVGQVNGLSVIQLGEHSFGRPSRITARVRLGSGKVVDIEREVDLSGPLHSKGVLILAGFLGARFALEHPLSLHATLVFEQSYGGIDGDSASSTELYALLSALAGLPLKQGIAVTGSVNQHGEVQPIGGVNEKVEGFFDACDARGLTGEQGVLIPETNVEHLMLHRRVVEAVADGRFHLWAVRHVDEGIALLTGTPAGVADSDGNWPAGSVNARVQKRLDGFAAARQRHRARKRESDGAGAATGAGRDPGEGA